MKFLFALFSLVVVPLVLFGMLLAAVAPLLVQHVFSRKTFESKVYPYLTSWEAEEAA